MIRAIAALLLALAVGVVAVGCASYGDYDYGDRPSPYSTGGGSGGGCH
jgi:hypothetical protein